MAQAEEAHDTTAGPLSACFVLAVRFCGRER
jgi:hypothetical protein